MSEKEIKPKSSALSIYLIISSFSLIIKLIQNIQANFPFKNIVQLLVWCIAASEQIHISVTNDTKTDPLSHTLTLMIYTH